MRPDKQAWERFWNRYIWLCELGGFKADVNLAKFLFNKALSLVEIDRVLSKCRQQDVFLIIPHHPDKEIPPFFLDSVISNVKTVEDAEKAAKALKTDDQTKIQVIRLTKLDRC